MGQILFYKDVFRLFSDKALIGIVAHEFAHALRAFRIGGNWYDEMQKRWRREEKYANKIAATWGFSSNIKAMERERKEIVDPYFTFRRNGR